MTTSTVLSCMACSNCHEGLECHNPIVINYVNLTPHDIKLNDGRTYEPSGKVARVAATFTEFDGDICHQQFGDITDLPEPAVGVRYIVSGLVKGATDRKDVVAPATGHPDTKRNEKGHIISAPGFIS